MVKQNSNERVCAFIFCPCHLEPSFQKSWIRHCVWNAFNGLQVRGGGKRARSQRLGNEGLSIRTRQTIPSDRHAINLTLSPTPPPPLTNHLTAAEPVNRQPKLLLDPNLRCHLDKCMLLKPHSSQPGVTQESAHKRNKSEHDRSAQNRKPFVIGNHAKYIYKFSTTFRWCFCCS